jgi:hypothetical protein
MAYKGVMVQRRPEFRVHLRLHQCELDAEGRPFGRLPVPPDEPHAPPRRPDRGAEARWTKVAERPFLDFTSGYVQRALPHLPQAG